MRPVEGLRKLLPGLLIEAPVQSRWHSNRARKAQVRRQDHRLDGVDQFAAMFEEPPPLPSAGPPLIDHMHGRSVVRLLSAPARTS